MKSSAMGQVLSETRTVPIGYRDLDSCAIGPDTIDLLESYFGAVKMLKDKDRSNLRERVIRVR
jgi:hypothetical protein